MVNSLTPREVLSNTEAESSRRQQTVEGLFYGQGCMRLPYRVLGVHGLAAPTLQQASHHATCMQLSPWLQSARDVSTHKTFRGGLERGSGGAPP